MYRTSIFALLLAFVSPQTLSAGGFMKFDGIDGEVVDPAGNEGAVEVLEFAHRIRTPQDATSGVPTGRRQHEPVRIIKRVDKSSPLLAQALTNNEQIPEVTLRFFIIDPETGRGTQYLEIKLKKVYVTSYSMSGSSGDQVPTEELSLNYEEITWTYTAADGTVNSHTDTWNRDEE